jgi:predicted metal-dependent phosphoesterase TrpH
VFLDMHCHSTASDDARSTVEQYLKWIQVLRKRGNQLDGIVLTEHRKFDNDTDYSELSRQYDVLILKGSELDTNCGHFLVYGVTQHLLRKFDFADVRIDAHKLVQEARRTGAIALPAHPGRANIGIANYLQRGDITLDDIPIVELLNGGSRPGENEAAAELVRAHTLLGTGGSDAHFSSAVGTCLTKFSTTISTAEELVGTLLEGKFRAMRIEETQNT